MEFPRGEMVLSNSRSWDYFLCRGSRQIETHRSYFARNLNYFYVPRWSNFNTNYLPYEELLQQTTVTIVLHSPWNTEPRSQIDQIAMWGGPQLFHPQHSPSTPPPRLFRPFRSYPARSLPALRSPSLSVEALKNCSCGITRRSSLTRDLGSLQPQALLRAPPESLSSLPIH